MKQLRRHNRFLTLFLMQILIILTALMAFPLLGDMTREDYDRADGLRTKFKGLVYNENLEVHWLDHQPMFWYRTDVRENRQFILVNAEKGSKTPAFDHARLANAISKAADKKFNGTKLPFSEILLIDNARAVEFDAAGDRWRCDLATYECKKLEKGEINNGQSQPSPKKRKRHDNNTTPEKQAAKSPDGLWDAFIQEYNLYLQSTNTGEMYPLTYDGTATHYYSPKILWSPDSKKLVTNIVKPGDNRQVHYIESSPEDQVQPKHTTRTYDKPGDKITIRKPQLFHVATKKMVALDDSLYANPFGIDDIRWNKDSSLFYFYFNQRGHQVVRVIEVDAETGKTRALIDERSDTFIDYAYKRYLEYLDDTDEIIWASERDGWSHLYLYDSRTGKVKNQITRGNWVWRGVDKLDKEKRQVWFHASGRNEGQDPYFMHYYRINFDGTGLTELTCGNGTHQLRYSPDRAYYIDTWSRVDMPPVHELRRSEDGSLVCELERADATDLYAAGWRAPEPFVSKSRDGKYDIWGIIIRPITFDATKSYPVLEDIYAGPHGSFVPKKWQSFYRQQSMAELGFILVKIDGMGTSNRCRDFHHFAWKNIADAGLPDRILWMKAAAQKYPFMDISRVGIFGGSAGGQSSTGALLSQPDFYKVAVSACGCHDNRMDKIWWNELWMGYPIGKEYEAQSNVTNAHKLQGKLLLIVGEMDTNVDPASTMQVVNALIKAKKDFELLVVPGMGHSDGGSYGERRRRDFFVRHLLDQKTPDWNTMH